MPQPQTPPVDPTALALSRAIRQKEGGDYTNYSGDNGTSGGAYQWSNGTTSPLKKGDIPANFKTDAMSLGLDPNDFSETNQDHVAYSKIESQLKQGLSQSQIAAGWNAGMGHINDWQSHKGTTIINGKPVSYDTPQYVADVQQLYEKQISPAGGGGSPPQSSLQAPEAPAPIVLGQNAQSAAPSNSAGGMAPPTAPTPLTIPGLNTSAPSTEGQDIAKGVGNTAGLIAPTAANFGTGLAKGALHTIYDASAFNAGPVGADMLAHAPGLQPVVADIKKSFAPQGIAQNVGAAIPQLAASVAGPGGMANDAELVPKLVDYVAAHPRILGVLKLAAKGLKKTATGALLAGGAELVNEVKGLISPPKQQ